MGKVFYSRVEIGAKESLLMEVRRHSILTHVNLWRKELVTVNVMLLSLCN